MHACIDAIVSCLDAWVVAQPLTLMLPYPVANRHLLQLVLAHQRREMIRIARPWEDTRPRHYLCRMMVTITMARGPAQT
jgi:hypothetical protein